MSDAKNITIQLDAVLREILLDKAFNAGRTIEDLVVERLRVSFQEDIEDLEAFEARKDEETIPFEEVVDDLQQCGLI